MASLFLFCSLVSCRSITDRLNTCSWLRTIRSTVIQFLCLEWALCAANPVGFTGLLSPCSRDFWNNELMVKYFGTYPSKVISRDFYYSWRDNFSGFRHKITVNCTEGPVWLHWFVSGTSFFHSFSNLSDDRSKASSKTIPPHSAI